MGTRGNQGLAWTLRPSQLLWKASDSARQFREARLLTAGHALGKRGEDLAHRYLHSAGYKVVARNYHAGADSEVDIVARHGDLVIFVEVKTRSSDEYAEPGKAVDQEKERHIIRAARSYLTRAGIEWSQARFDVIGVVMTTPPTITHQQDAFFHGRVF